MGANVKHFHTRQVCESSQVRRGEATLPFKPTVYKVPGDEVEENLRRDGEVRHQRAHPL